MLLQRTYNFSMEDLTVLFLMTNSSTTFKIDFLVSYNANIYHFFLFVYHECSSDLINIFWMQMSTRLKLV